MDGHPLDLQRRWEALHRQVQLIQQMHPAATDQRVDAVLDWLCARLDQLEMDLGMLAAEAPDERQ